MVSIPSNSLAAPSTHAFNAAGSATSIALPHALTPFIAKALTTLATSSALRAQIATLAPSSAKSSATARPIPLLPPVTSTLFPLSPRSIAASVWMRRPAFRKNRPPDELHLRPVARALECGSRPIDGRLVVIFADQHQAYRQALAHPAGQAHRRMPAGIEGSGVRNHFERALDIEFAQGICRWQRRRLHR